MDNVRRSYILIERESPDKESKNVMRAFSRKENLIQCFFFRFVNATFEFSNARKAKAQKESRI